MTRRINAAGLSILRQYEGCKLKAYPDPGTGGEPWTIGWGSTGPDIKRGLVWTQQKCDERLLLDLQRFEAGVEAIAPDGLSSNEFSALVVLGYNIGLGALRNSTLMRKLKAGDRAGAAEEFLRWNKSGARTLLGLTRRRIAERELFLRRDEG
jgi:lysozyme